MDIKQILGIIMGGIVVDKNNASNYAKKLNFDLYSKQCYKPIFSEQEHNLKKIKDLSGPMFIIIKWGDKCFKVHCSENTKIKEFFDGYHPSTLVIGQNFFSYEEIKEKTLKFFGTPRLIRIGIEYNPGGGEEFYIDDDLLDPSYDYDFRDILDGNKKFYRGGLEYKRPCGWKRYALKVEGKYENDKWLGDSGGDSEWAVSYHGTKQENMKSIYDNGYRVGNRNAYGVGVYCSPNIETAAEYSDEFYGYNGKKYKIVLQNRVRPSAIKKASDNGGPDDYWYIESGKDIRPYSICVKEC